MPLHPAAATTDAVARILASAALSRYTASYLIVMDLFGVDIRISPTMRESGDGKATRAVAAQRLHFCALKPRDPTHFLLGGNNNSLETGPAYLWNWKSDEYIELGKGTTMNCHDAQWSVEYPGSGSATTDGAIWMPTPQAPGDAFALINTTSGEKIKEIQVAGTWDINHVQLLEEDTVAIISSRMTNEIMKINISTGEVVWTCGGNNGDFELVDGDGTKYERARRGRAGGRLRSVSRWRRPLLTHDTRPRSRDTAGRSGGRLHP